MTNHDFQAHLEQHAYPDEMRVDNGGVWVKWPDGAQHVYAITMSEANHLLAEAEAARRPRGPGSGR